MRKKAGFTLVELMIVMAIIGILASILIPRLVAPTEKGRAAEAVTTLGTIRHQEEVYRNGEAQAYISTGQNSAPDPNGWQDLGMDNPNTRDKYFVYWVEVPAQHPDRFVAVAQRRASQNEIDQGRANLVPVGRRIALNNLGTWSGTTGYAGVPENRNGACGVNVQEACTVATIVMGGG